MWATLLDEGTYLCSESTMYRLLREHAEVRPHTPASVHFGTLDEIRRQRARTLADAYATHPNRSNSNPDRPMPPGAAWINKPVEQTA